MAEVLDRGAFWELVIDPSARPVENIDEWGTKGYKAVLGENSDGVHTVMNVQYDKSKFTIEDVVKKVESVRSCGRCQALDKAKMKIDKIQVGAEPSGTVTGNVRGMDINPSSAGVPSEPPVTALQTVRSKGNSVKDMFANTFFDAFMTKPGKYFFALMSGDDILLDNVVPKNDLELDEFMDEMVAFMNGDIDFVRSAEEAKEYLGVLRAGREERAARSSGSVRRVDKKKKPVPMMTVY